MRSMTGDPSRDGTRTSKGQKSGEITEVSRSQDDGQDDQGNVRTQPKGQTGPSRRATLPAPRPGRPPEMKPHRPRSAGAAPRARPHDRKPKDSLCCSIQ